MSRLASYVARGAEQGQVSAGLPYFSGRANSKLRPNLASQSLDIGSEVRALMFEVQFLPAVKLKDSSHGWRGYGLNGDKIRFIHALVM